MAMLVIGLVLLSCKLAGVGPVGAWPWWGVLLPFGLALLWWSWADAFGWTQRRAMERFTARRQKRREKHLQALGVKGGRRRGR